MSSKDGNADKEVPSSSRKTPLLGARGLYIKSGLQIDACRSVSRSSKTLQLGVVKPQPK